MLTAIALSGALLLVVLAWWALGGTRTAGTPTTFAAAQQRAAELSEKFEAALVNERDPSPLLDDIEQLVADRPDLPEAHRLLGQMHSVHDHNGLAYASFERALALANQDAELHVLAGSVAEKLEHWENADAHYHAAQTQKPDDAELWVRLANVAVKQKRWDDARPLLVDALKRDAALHEAHALMAVVYEQEGNPDAALASLEQAYNLLAVKGGQDLQKIALRLSEVLMKRGEPVLAAKVLRLPELDEFFTPDIMAAHAQALDAAGLSYDAGQYYEQWSRRAPANAHAAARAAHWYLQSDSPDQARAMLVVLRRIDPRHPDLHAMEQQLRQQTQPPTP